MKTFKHRETGETATYEDGIMTQGRCSVEVGREPSSEYWDEVIDNNPLKLEVGKTYKIKYKYCPSSIQTVTVTRFAKQGFPWSDDIGIITDYYNLIEEVVEKDYEILQMKSVNSDHYTLFKNEEPSRYEKENYTIYEIKRLSDGEVFTVGDKIKLNQVSTFPRIIKSIHRCEDGKQKIIFYNDNGGMIYLNDALKLKKPLLITEDGVDIFEGDKYYTVYTMKDNKCGIYKTWQTQNAPFIANGEKEDFVHEDVHYFSTKEAAEEFILMNKPCLSINDIVKIMEEHRSSYMYNSTWIKLLKELIKSKL